MRHVIAYVGAGGKTSSILEDALRLQTKPKRLVVTTTTHMRRPQRIPEGTDQLTETVEEAAWRLDRGEVVWYGHPAGGRRFAGPSPEEWEALCGMTDYILVEADGSKRLPVKIPAAHEPVIPTHTDQIRVVMGMSGLGKPLNEVCHRLPLILELLEKEETDCLTEQDYQKILLQGYFLPLQKRFPACSLELYLNQVDESNMALLEPAKRIGSAVADAVGGITVQYTNYTRALLENIKAGNSDFDKSE